MPEVYEPRECQECLDVVVQGVVHRLPMCQDAFEYLPQAGETLQQTLPGSLLVHSIGLIVDIQLFSSWIDCSFVG